jgi:hypothetical protein
VLALEIEPQLALCRSGQFGVTAAKRSGSFFVAGFGAPVKKLGACGPTGWRSCQPFSSMI